MRSLEKLYTPTPLYGLKLLRTSEGDPESLHSYFQRLAFAHRVTPHHLLHKFVAWRHHERTGYHMTFASGADAGIRMLGATKAAQRFCTEFTILNGVKGLELGTALTLSGHCSTQELVTPADRVCLACVQEDLEIGKASFGRLLWRLACVRCCPRHGCNLVEVGHCGPMPFKFDRRKPAKLYGVCPACASIGYKCLTRGEEAGPEELATAVLCRDLLVAAPHLPSTSEAAKSAFRELAMTLEAGYSGVAKNANLNKSILARWLNAPDARLTLPAIIAIAKVLEVTAVQFLRGEMTSATREPTRTVGRQKRVFTTSDPASLKAALEAALDSDSTSAADILRTFKVDKKALRRADPVLLDKLVKRRTQQRAEQIQKRWEDAYDRAASVALRLRALGHRVTLQAASALEGGNRWTPTDVHSRVLFALASGNVEKTIRRHFIPADIADRCRKFVADREATKAQQFAKGPVSECLP
ncbi:hypothetical protein GCM10007320_29830 [Pseudorhodoferax aquiterrae]|uniref:HTH cro/C1-type domain-containing protein n=1 Tax=Pseudorhodoferax aquiterrae TaxID=747304 RepID=A0ABQ3G2J6_9BURK|nr:TniQ family protein [Pseudorhodoferax aquiterrae]GHC85116.1 hypothetical protein GCM10007320_29830 [Pseudorhodoferax aquiterrae]